MKVPRAKTSLSLSKNTHVAYSETGKKSTRNETRRESTLVIRWHDKVGELRLCWWFEKKSPHRSAYLMNLKRFDERKVMYLLTVGISFPGGK